MNAASYEAMWQPQHDAHGRLTDYGLGFGVQLQSTGRLKVWHDGQQEKATCRMVLYPGSRSVVVVMTNSEFAQPGKISTAIYSALDHAKTVPAPKPGDDDFVQPEG